MRYGIVPGCWSSKLDLKFLYQITCILVLLDQKSVYADFIDGLQSFWNQGSKYTIGINSQWNPQIYQQ